MAVEKVDIPAGVRRGQPFDMRVVLRNDAAEGADASRSPASSSSSARPASARRPIAEQDVDVAPGKQVFTIPQQIDQPDFYTYEARFVPDDPAADGMAQNNVAIGLHAHPRQGPGAADREHREAAASSTSWSSGCAAQDIEVTVVGTDQLFNSLAELQRYDAVVLANVPRSAVDDVDNVASFSDEQIEMLVRNTARAGLRAGDDRRARHASAPAAGPTRKLEEAMPVDFQIKSAKVVPVGALVPDDARRRDAAGQLLAEEDRHGSRSSCSAAATTAASCSGTAPTSGSGASRPGGLIRVGPNRQMMLARIDRLQIGDMPAFDGGMKHGRRRLRPAAPTPRSST